MTEKQLPEYCAIENTITEMYWHIRKVEARPFELEESCAPTARSARSPAPAGGAHR
jgi:hypothetical protein